VRRAKLKLGVAALGRAGFNWTSGWCHRCGVHFVDRNLDTRFCSARCQRRSDSARRRARESGADSDGYRRHLVFERDGWRCHMCGELTDPAQVVPHPKAPTIDHLLPLARGGSDTLGNVSTACFKCNCMKGDRQSHPPFLLVTEGGGYP
jgi:5-methylcytosine-specific restriction endonuclease McrA